MSIAMYGIMNSEATTPEVNMPATYNIGSDSYAGQITYVSPTRGFVMMQIQSLGEKRFNRCQDGRYRSKGGVGFLTLGKAVQALDPCF